MKPISQERVTWLTQRLIIVERCIDIAKANMYAMSSGGVRRDELQNVLMTLNTERVAIEIELHVLNEMVTP